MRGTQSGAVVKSALFMALMLIAVVNLAQDETVSYSDVKRVAERMYCPVCENIPLDECETTACREWKDEIRAQLAAGRTEQEIINSFVSRFGDDVVGVPQDPLLRALAFIVPLLSTALAIGVGVFTFRRFNSRQKLRLDDESATVTETSDDMYRQRLENDLLARR